MRKRLNLGLALVFSLMLAAVPWRTAAAETATVFDLTGAWNSPEWGIMGLFQLDDQVFGSYEYNNGQLEGTIDGRRLTFRWWESVALGEPYESADPGQRGDGYFVISRDGTSLSGQWRYEGSTDWDGDWTAELMSDDLASETLTDFTGVWDSPEWGEMILGQSYNMVAGIYAYNGGQIEGTVEGQTLWFRWWEGTDYGEPYEHAAPGSRGDGYLVLSDGGQGFSGKWRYEGSSSWNGTWTAYLVSKY